MLWSRFLWKSQRCKITIKAEQWDWVFEWIIICPLIWIHCTCMIVWDISKYQGARCLLTRLLLGTWISFFFLAGCFVIFTLFFGLFLGASDCIIRLDLETENKMVSDKVTFIPLHYHRWIFSALVPRPRGKKNPIINNRLDAGLLRNPLRALR